MGIQAESREMVSWSGKESGGVTEDQGSGALLGLRLKVGTSSVC